MSRLSGWCAWTAILGDVAMNKPRTAAPDYAEIMVRMILAEVYRRRRPAERPWHNGSDPGPATAAGTAAASVGTPETPPSLHLLSEVELHAPLGGVQGSPGRIRPARLAEVATPQQDRGRANPVLDQAPPIVVCQRWGNLPQGLSACSNHRPIWVGDHVSAGQHGRQSLPTPDGVGDQRSESQ